MIAIIFNNAAGGATEFELRLPNSTEKKIGLTYAASNEERYGGAVIQSASTYTPNGKSFLYFDRFYPDGRVFYHSSNVHNPVGQATGGIFSETEGWEIRYCGYGPGLKPLYSRVDYSGDRFIMRRRWHIYLGATQLTQTPGFLPIHLPGDGLIYFVPVGADDTLRRMDENGSNERVAHRFEGGYIRALAVTQNRSTSRLDIGAGRDELLVSVYFPMQGKTTVFACYDSGRGMSVHKRFDVAIDGVMLAGTGIFGNGTRIVYTQGQSIFLWDSRNGSIHTIQYWKMNPNNDRNFLATPIGPFRQSELGTGLAISPDVPKMKTMSKRSPIPAAAA